MLEKGKGQFSEKLRTMSLAEVDFKLLMRAFVNEIIIGFIETDDIMSKVNHGSRKGCSIDDFILEKRLLYDFSMQNMEETVHNFTDLESCYYRN